MIDRLGTAVLGLLGWLWFAGALLGGLAAYYGFKPQPAMPRLARIAYWICSGVLILTLSAVALALTAWLALLGGAILRRLG